MELKIIKIGNSKGVILPKKILKHLNAENKGDSIWLSESPNGYMLSEHKDEIAKQIELGRKIMKKYDAVLRELAK